MDAAELTSLYHGQKQTIPEDFFEGAGLPMLSEHLDSHEDVLAILGFTAQLERTSYVVVRRVGKALLVVTSQRVLFISEKGLLGLAQAVVTGSDTVDLSWLALNEIRGVSGRRTATSLGLGRALHLHLKAGSFVKILGLNVGQSEFAEEAITTALLSAFEQEG